MFDVMVNLLFSIYKFIPRFLAVYNNIPKQSDSVVSIAREPLALESLVTNQISLATKDSSLSENLFTKQTRATFSVIKSAFWVFATGDRLSWETFLFRVDGYFVEKLYATATEQF